MYESKEDVVEKMREIAALMEQRTKRHEELKSMVLMDRGRLEELKNLYDMFDAKEKEMAEKPAPKKAPAKKRAKK